MGTYNSQLVLAEIHDLAAPAVENQLTEAR